MEIRPLPVKCFLRVYSLYTNYIAKAVEINVIKRNLLSTTVLVTDSCTCTILHVYILCNAVDNG